MIYKIIEQLLKEDTFDCFTEHNLQGLTNEAQSVASLKSKLETFFNEIHCKNDSQSLIANECVRMLYILEKIISEIEDDEEPEKDDDCIINIYTESLRRFVEGIEDEDVKKQVNYICS